MARLTMMLGLAVSLPGAVTIAQAQGGADSRLVVEDTTWLPSLFTEQTAPVNWARYELISECLTAIQYPANVARNAEARQRHGEDIPDSLVLKAWAAARRSDIPGVVSVARRCLQQFPLARTAVADLPVYQRVAMAAHDDARLDSAFRRQLASLDPPSDSAVWTTFLQAPGLDLASTLPDRGIVPVRRDLWERYVALADSLLPGHAHMFRALMRVQSALRDERDTTPVTPSQLRAAAATLRAVAAKKPKAGKKGWQRAQDSIQAVRGLQVATLLSHYANLLTPDSSYEAALAAVKATILNGSGMGGSIGDGPGVGDTLPEITGQIWLHSDGTTTPRYRRPGRPTLVLSGGTPSVRQGLIVRRLQDRFPNLDVAIIATTEGLASSNDSLNPGEINPASISEEVVDERAYYFTRLGLRGTLIVDTAPHIKITTTPSDNRVIYGVAPTLERMPGPPTGLGDASPVRQWMLGLVSPDRLWLRYQKAFLLDGQGRVVWTGWRSTFDDTDRLLDALVARLTGASSATPAVAPTPASSISTQGGH